MTLHLRSHVRSLFGVLCVGLSTIGCADWQRSGELRLGSGGIAGQVGRSDVPAREPVGVDAGRLADGRVLVYVQPVGAKPRRASWGPPDEIAIRDGRQVPEVHMLPPNGELVIRNLDAIYHDLFSGDPDQPFAVRLKGGESSDPIRLRRPGFVRGFCRLHPEESFAIVVRDARRVVELGPGRGFEIRDLPPGEYHVRAASADGEGRPARVRVTRGETTRLTLSLSTQPAA